MTRSAKTQYTIDVLTKAVAQRKRLKNGLRRRDELLRKMEQQEDYTRDYRYRFMVESTDAVVELLRDLAEKFDRTYPDDQCSNLDIHDILKLVIAKMERL